MTKQEFLEQLRKGLSGLPQAELEERLGFYAEMIDDRMEEGLTEGEAVAAIGAVDEIIGQIVDDTPFSTIAKEKFKPKRQMKAWEIVLLILGSPIWVSLLLAAFAVVFALYVVVWSLVISLWAMFAAFAVCTPVCLAVGIVALLRGNGVAGAALLGAGFLLAGFSILLFFGCRAAAKGALRLTGKVSAELKRRLIRKEEA